MKLIKASIVPFILILFSVLSHGVTADEKINLEVYDALKNQTMIEVGVTLKDNSGIDVGLAKSPNEKSSLIKENEDLNSKVTHELINSLSFDEFTATPDGEISPRYFRGNITAKGLDRLKNDPRILKIYLPVPAHTQIIADGAPPEYEIRENQNYLLILIGMFVFVIVYYCIKLRKNANR